MGKSRAGADIYQFVAGSLLLTHHTAEWVKQLHEDKYYEIMKWLIQSLNLNLKIFQNNKSLK